MVDLRLETLAIAWPPLTADVSGNAIQSSL